MKLRFRTIVHHLIVAIVFISLSASVSASEDSDIPQLKILAGRAVFNNLIDNFEKVKDKPDQKPLTLICQYRNSNIIASDLQRLIFSELYRPTESFFRDNYPGQLDLAMTFLGYMPGLDLSDYGLSKKLGTTPSLLQPFQSTFLRHLIVDNNSLQQYISYFQILTNLSSLSVCNNRLGVYVTNLQKLTNLKALDISVDHFGSHVSCLKALTNLTYLNAQAINLEKSTNFIQYLTNLEILHISHNPHLREHTKYLSPLTNLTCLTIRTCWIKEHVSCLMDFTKLVELDVGYNGIGDNVVCLQPLINLAKLAICGNFPGEQISLLKSLTNLTSLKANVCGLNSKIIFLQPFSNLTDLSLRVNALEQQDVIALQPLTKLKQLYIGDNKIGQYLHHLTILTGLKELEVASVGMPPKDILTTLVQLTSIGTNIITMLPS